MRVNGEFKHFAKINEHVDDFDGKVVGVGLIHSPADSSLKAFASCQGHYLGKNLIKILKTKPKSNFKQILA
jgi:hypothetical protein